VGLVSRTESRRLVLEGVVIVASILAAFALDRGWEGVRDRQEERETLAALESEFRSARSALEAPERLERRVLHSVESIRDSLARAVERGSATIALPDTALGLLYIPPTTQLVLGTRDGLMTSDRLSVIRSRELRAALAVWGRLLAELNEDERSSRELVFTDLDRVFRARANTHRFRWVANDLLRGRLSDSQASAVSFVRVDEEILGVVATRFAIADHALSEFGPVFDEIDHILMLIAGS
jgi:hypothetical protein